MRLEFKKLSIVGVALGLVGCGRPVADDLPPTDGSSRRTHLAQLAVMPGGVEHYAERLGKTTAEPSP